MNMTPQEAVNLLDIVAGIAAVVSRGTWRPADMGEVQTALGNLRTAHAVLRRLLEEGQADGCDAGEREGAVGAVAGDGGDADALSDAELDAIIDGNTLEVVDNRGDWGPDEPCGLSQCPTCDPLAGHRYRCGPDCGDVCGAGAGPGGVAGGGGPGAGPGDD